MEVSVGLVLPGGSEECLLPVSTGRLQSLACSHVAPISTFVITWPSSLCVPFSSHKDPGHRI